MIGAREHYAVPRALHALGQLSTLYTDAWAGPLLRLATVGSLRSLAGRHHAGIPAEQVVAFTGASALRWLWRKVSKGGAESADYEEYLRVGAEFAQRVNRHLRRLQVIRRPAGFFGYNTGSLETLRLFRDWGLAHVVDQIDAARVHERVVAEELRRWPGWGKPGARIPEAYWERIEAEWEAAEVVIVNSEWSKQALLSLGVAPDKIRVVPLAYEATATPAEVGRTEMLNVLFVGRVVLEKGIPYLFEAAKLLRGESVRFTVVGPIHIPRDAIQTAPDNVIFAGPADRSLVHRYYRTADVFLLPTLSDGFAITQLEAMAHGLPVVATGNCGNVVQDGVNGLLVPARDSVALAEAISSLNADRHTLQAMSEQATRTVAHFSLAATGRQLYAHLAPLIRRGGS